MDRSDLVVGRQNSQLHLHLSLKTASFAPLPAKNTRTYLFYITQLLVMLCKITPNGIFNDPQGDVVLSTTDKKHFGIQKQGPTVV